MNNKNIFIDNNTINRQFEILNEIKTYNDRPRYYHIVTFGCQMNVNDSQKIAFMFDKMGMQESEDRNNSDLVLFNTCCVRDNAERKALGNIFWLKELKKKKPDLIIAVCGCMIQQKDMSEKILKQYKFIDIAFGTHNLYMFPQILLNFLKSRKQIIQINDEHIIAEGLGSKRDIAHHAFVSIMYGCNNFCTFCIVPHVRGRERSRKIDDILFEVDTLLKNGVKEIMFLGQNVNSYGLGSDDNVNFPKLLKKMDSIGVPRIRFMTSHPKDLSDELIDVIKNCKSVAKHIHLPVQSGSSKILKLMNRKYNREYYLSLVDKLKLNIPNIGITTDIIVGFPGETDDDFSDTLSLVNEVKYDSAFTFIYSKRKGTIAYDMKDQIPEEISSLRLQMLNHIINQNSYDILNDQLNKTEIILTDDYNPKNNDFIFGRTSRNIKVNIKNDGVKIGEFYKVKITNIENNILYAERI